MVTGPVGRAFADAEMIFSTLEGFGFQPKLARDDPSL